jgi:hypothetical protein
VVFGEADGKENTMKTYFGHAALALALLAGTAPAGAQWIYSDGAFATRPVVTPPLALTQAQRTIIYRTIIPQGRNRQPIVREQIITEPVAPVVGGTVVAPVDSYAYGTVDAYAYGRPDYNAYGYARPNGYSAYANGNGAYAYAVGTRVAPNVRLAPLPPAVVAAVPSARAYQYMVINQRLLLVDPDTGIVVADLTR